MLLEELVLSDTLGVLRKVKEEVADKHLANRFSSPAIFSWSLKVHMF